MSLPFNCSTGAGLWSGYSKSMESASQKLALCLVYYVCIEL